MSQHVFNTVTMDGRPVQVVMGWDRPLQYYFLTVQALDAEWQPLSPEGEHGESEGYLYSNLYDPEIPLVDNQLAYYSTILYELGLDVPMAMLSALSYDRSVNRGHHHVVYQPNGESRALDQETIS